jgi:hypothetical protein
LYLPRRLEALHLSLSLSGRLVRILCPVVQSFMLPMLNARRDPPLCRTVAGQLVVIMMRGAASASSAACVVGAWLRPYRAGSGPARRARCRPGRPRARASALPRPSSPQPDTVGEFPWSAEESHAADPKIGPSSPNPPSPSAEQTGASPFAYSITTTSRCHLSPAQSNLRRIRLAKSWPNLRAHCHTVSWLTMMPHATSISSTMRRLSGKLKYSQTAWLDDLGRKPVAGVAGKGRPCHPVRLRDLARYRKPPT